MNTRLTTLLGIAILAIASTLVVVRMRGFGAARDETHAHRDAPDGATEAATESSPGSAGEGADGAIRRSGSRPGARTPAAQLSIQDLVDRGFEINADRIGRIVAEGNVELRCPDGAVAFGDELRESREGGEYVISGNPGIRQGGGLISAEEADLYLRVGADQVYCSPGMWKTTVQREEPNRQAVKPE